MARGDFAKAYGEYVKECRAQGGQPLKRGDFAKTLWNHEVWQANRVLVPTIKAQDGDNANNFGDAE